MVLGIEPSFTRGSCFTPRPLLHPGNSTFVLSKVARRKACSRAGPCSDFYFNKVTLVWVWRINQQEESLWKKWRDQWGRHHSDLDKTWLWWQRQWICCGPRERAKNGWSSPAAEHGRQPPWWMPRESRFGGRQEQVTQVTPQMILWPLLCLSLFLLGCCRNRKSNSCPLAGNQEDLHNPHCELLSAPLGSDCMCACCICLGESGHCTRLVSG